MQLQDEQMKETKKVEPNHNLVESKSFKSKVKIRRLTPAGGNKKDVKIIVPLKYFSSFWRTLEMPLINCEVSLFLTWSSTCVITNSTGEGRFTITDTKLYVPVVTLSTQDNAKLLQQLKSGFKRTINWNKYQSDPKTYAQNRYLNHLVNPSFQGVHRLFVLSRSTQTFCIIFWKWKWQNIAFKLLSSKSTNKRLQCYDWR